MTKPNGLNSYECFLLGFFLKLHYDPIALIDTQSFNIKIEIIFFLTSDPAGPENNGLKRTVVVVGFKDDAL